MGWEERRDALVAALVALSEFTDPLTNPTYKFVSAVTQHLFSPLSKLDAIVAPTVNDDSDSGYGVGSHWYDLVAAKAYVCLDPKVNEAVWVEDAPVGAGGGGEKYVDRGDPSAYDWALGDLTADATWRDLDLTGVIPAAAYGKLIHFSGVFQATGTAGRFAMRKNGQSNARNEALYAQQVANIAGTMHWWVLCDSNGVVEYSASAHMSVASFIIRGWMEDA